MIQSLYDPRGRSGTPSPQVMADGALRLVKVAQGLRLLNWGGDPPADLSGLPDPAGLPDKPLSAKANYIIQAGTLFAGQAQPLKIGIDQLVQVLRESETSWQLYACSAQVMQSCEDYQLVAAAGHRLVLARVLPAVIDALREDGLAQAERDGLVLDLMELRALIAQDLAALRATRATGADEKAALAAQLDELSAEEQLVDVMLRLGRKEDVPQADMQQAAATYKKLLAQTAEEAAGTATPAEQGNRRASGR